MALTKLVQKRVEKVWGRRDLPDYFGGTYSGKEPLGEIWFEHPDRPDLDLLVKYLFTSEKLSIQVHPDHHAAAQAGYRSGKDEAWVILDAKEEAVIGLGLTRSVTGKELRKSALDGSIEDLVHWRSASKGDILYSPAGTIHAIGPDLMVLEIQQNVDVTYRLYDYGRPRQLHLDEGITASCLAPHHIPITPSTRSQGREVLVEGRAFVLERWSPPALGTVQPGDRPLWLVPLAGIPKVDEVPLALGTVWLLDGGAEVSLAEGSQLLVAYMGSDVSRSLLRSREAR